MRCLAFYFSVIILFSLTFHPCEAATISPELQSVLQTAPSSQEVAIIINLADKVDVKQIPTVPLSRTREGRKIRRNAIAVALKDKANKTQGPLKTLLQSRGGKKIKPLWITNSVAVTVPASVINELAGSPQIASIELDAVIPASPIIPAVAGTPRWNIDRVNAPTLWSAGIDGTGVVVASLDTGIDVNHPDLKYRWRGGACSSPPDCPSWFDPYNNTTTPYGIPATGGSFTELDAIHAHGTSTMGIMVGGSASPGGYAIGVAPEAKWISAKIFDDSGNALTSDILAAFQWAFAPAGDAANAPDIVNNSWTAGGQDICYTSDPLDPYISSLPAAISTLQNAGIEVIFSAGNVPFPGPAASSSSFSPANYPGVFAVGATDIDNVIFSLSAWGPSACLDRTTNFPNVAAPGVNIYSSVPTGGKFGTYNYSSGTSMAAAHVSGAAALLAGAMPALTPAQIEEALEQSAFPLVGASPNDTSPNNIYGYGLLDAAAAYQYAFINYSGKEDVPQIASLPPSAYFTNGSASCTFDLFQNPLAVSCTIFIVNQGTADLMINPGGVSFTGPNAADFNITTDNCSGQTVASLSNCSVIFTFSPGAAGSRIAQLSVTSNDTSTSTLNIPLRGNDPVALVQGSAIVATYADIQTAASDCSNWDDIRMQTGILSGTPDFNLPLGITVSLLGGYDPAFASQTGSTTISGTLTISMGTVIIGNVIVQ